MSSVVQWVSFVHTVSYLFPVALYRCLCLAGTAFFVLSCYNASGYDRVCLDLGFSIVSMFDFPAFLVFSLSV